MGGPVQHVVVMRHGDRIDACESEPMWAAHAARPWDPPLIEPDGNLRAWATGKRLRGLGFPVHRVLVSPFLRCLQTAAQVVSALCAAVDDDARLLPMETGADARIDPTRVKVSIEYGLCEILGRPAISIDYVPKDGNWFPDVSELEALLPAGTIDHSVERVYQELPHWEEPIIDARNRYKNVIKALADKFPHENLLLVTHGEAVGVSVSSFLRDVEVFGVEYCAYSHLQRHITFETPEDFTAEDFEVLTKSGETGISYYPRRVVDGSY